MPHLHFHLPTLPTLLPLLTTLLTTALALALPNPSNWQPWSSPTPQAQALYVMTNDIVSNSVIAMSIAPDGTLSGGTSFSTGGIGGNYLNPATGAALFPDALSAQDAVVVSGNYLFAVNAGSSTVSLFAISPSNPTHLTLLGPPASTQGDFPTTLAASAALGCVCVGNSGATSGVSCSKFSASGLEGFDALRAMDVGESTTPPLGPVPGFGDLLFSEDDDLLIALVKGNGTEFTGYAATFPVTADGTVGRTPTQATPPGSKALFGSATVPGQPDVIFTSDAGFGALTLNIMDLNAEPIAVVNVTGQKASCWAGVTATGRGFVTDAAVNRLVEADVETGAIVLEYHPPTGFQGMTDFRIGGEYVWVLSASNGSYATSVSTFDISGGPGSVELASVYAVPSVGGNTQGLAIW